MTDNEWDEFLIWVRTHTALGRLAQSELQTAFERASAAGFAVVKFEPVAAPNV